jgi:hypothetical protein
MDEFDHELHEVCDECLNEMAMDYHKEKRMKRKPKYEDA